MMTICKPSSPTSLAFNTLVPNRGLCHGVFLLCHSTRLGIRRNQREWAESARERATFMAGALDFDTIAAELIRAGLAAYYEDRIVVDAALRELSTCADRATLVAIATTIISKSPPAWLSIVAINKKINREYIPSSDLEDLSWIEPELDDFLLNVSALSQHYVDEAFSKRLGDAAELFLLAAFNLADARPIHVARVSDTYGYDIECHGAGVDRVEVKAASSSTRGRFHLSRNEFDKSVMHGREWRLIQLTFSNHAFIDDELNISHVDSIRELRSEALLEIIPSDTAYFRWTESALIMVPDRYWQSPNLKLDPNFVTKGIRRMPVEE